MMINHAEDFYSQKDILLLTKLEKKLGLCSNHVRIKWQLSSEKSFLFRS